MNTAYWCSLQGLESHLLGRHGGGDGEPTFHERRQDFPIQQLREVLSAHHIHVMRVDELVVGEPLACIHQRNASLFTEILAILLYPLEHLRRIPAPELTPLRCEDENHCDSSTPTNPERFPQRAIGLIRDLHLLKRRAKVAAGQIRTTPRSLRVVLQQLRPSAQSVYRELIFFAFGIAYPTRYLRSKQPAVLVTGGQVASHKVAVDLEWVLVFTSN